MGGLDRSMRGRPPSTRRSAGLLRALLAALALAGAGCEPSVEVVARFGGGDGDGGDGDGDSDHDAEMDAASDGDVAPDGDADADTDADLDHDAETDDGGDLEPEPLGMTAGEAHTCLWSRGEAYCWGRNGDGEVGDGTRDERTRPVLVSTLTEVAGLAAGGYPDSGPVGHTCGWRRDGSAYCWGAGSLGQIGDGGARDRLLPVPVDLPPVAGMALGGDHSCAWTASGEAYCWGDNAFGQLGDGTTEPQVTPQAVPDLEDVAAMVAGYGYTCAVHGDGTVTCWGLRLGFEGLPYDPRPTIVPGLEETFGLGAGESHCCALTPAGVLSCWGDNYFGQLGDGSTGDRTYAAEVSVAPVVDVEAGDIATCAVTREGALFCWGCYIPEPMGRCHESPFEAGGLPPVSGVAVGAGFGCAWTAAGAAYCWGDNSYGQLGNGAHAGELEPVPVVF